MEIKQSLSYILNHLGEHRKNYFNAVSPPIIQSSNFIFPDFDDFRKSIKDELNNHIYTRGNNPTVEILRKKIAALEKTEDALIFSSGMAAISTAVISRLKSGDHVICVNDPYSWTSKLVVDFLHRFGVQSSWVDGSSVESIALAIQPNTKVLYLESPNTATFELQDLEACAKLAKANKITSIIDNSYASPIFQQPAKFGIDIVVHSASKYLNGHSDVIAGVICASSTMIRTIFQSNQMILGNIISPNDAFLMIRGLRTLKLRLDQIDRSTRKIVAFLKAHSKIEAVFYPFDAEFPQYELAQKQMSGCGGLFSVQLSTKDPHKIEAFYKRLELFLFAVSWGGHESLILPFCCFFDNPGFQHPNVPLNLVRFYIGLEEPELLIQDLDQALTMI